VKLRHRNDKSAVDYRNVIGTNLSIVIEPVTDHFSWSRHVSSSSSPRVRH